MIHHAVSEGVHAKGTVCLLRAARVLHNQSRISAALFWHLDRSQPSWLPFLCGQFVFFDVYQYVFQVPI